MDREKKLEILDSEEGYYTDLYLDEYFDKQFALIKKITDVLTPEEIEILEETVDECGRELRSILDFLKRK